MMKKSTIFRQHHFFELLNRFDTERGPIDLFVSLYLRHNPQLGSKDRLYIVEKIYAYLRWKELIELLLDRAGVRDDARKEALFDVLEQDLFSFSKDPTIEPHVRVSFPKNLYRALHKTFGDETDSVCLSCNEAAPIVLRANVLKTTRDVLLEKLRAQGIDVAEEPSAPSALRLSKRVNLFSLPEFKEGLFEVQDAGSQLVGGLVDAQPGESVLDYCAGAGGKTLCFAPKLQNRGQIFLHDIRESALLEAKKRLKRAGIQNAQIVRCDDTPRLRSMKHRMDWVLVDVPCSGTGTLRRNPDMKWKFSDEMVARLVLEQRQIFSLAHTYLKPGGTIVYATCSLLAEENEEQLAYFLRTFPLEVVGQPFRSRPVSGAMDGFFAVCLRSVPKI